MPTLVPVVAIVVVLVIGVAGYLIWRGTRDQTAERLERLDDFVSEWQPAPDETSSTDVGGKSMRDQVAERLDNLVARRGFGTAIKAQLRKADMKLTVTEYLVLHVVAVALFGLIGYVVRGPAIAAVAGLAGFFAPRFYVSTQQRRRLRSFNDQLPDILNLWVNSLRAGYSVPQAMGAVAQEAPPPASDEFRRVVAEMSIGIPTEVALNNMLARLDSEDLDLVFTAVNIQREVGGNLAEILDTISHTIRERLRIKGEIRVLTSSARATGTLIGALPILLSVFLYIINPEYMGQLFFGPPRGAYLPGGLPIPCGWPIIALGLIMMAIGMAIIRRITDIEV